MVSARGSAAGAGVSNGDFRREERVSGRRDEGMVKRGNEGGRSGGNSEQLKKYISGKKKAICGENRR